MSRAPFQVLIIPFYCSESGKIEYAIFRRRDSGYWQGIAGGGEDKETPLQAAKREAQEEGGVPKNSHFIALDAVCSISVDNFADGTLWDEGVLVIPEYSFGVEIRSRAITLSAEHLEYRWVEYDEALRMLKWDSNKTALWELNQRLQQGTTSA